MRTVTVQLRRGAGGLQLPLSHCRAARGPDLSAAAATALIATSITHWLRPHHTKKRTKPCTISCAAKRGLGEKHPNPALPVEDNQHPSKPSYANHRVAQNAPTVHNLWEVRGRKSA